MQPYAPMGSAQEPSLRGCLGLWHTRFKDSHIQRYTYFTLQKGKQATQRVV